MIKVMHVVGARPNFPKTAPIMSAMARRPDVCQQLLVHTGQHYDHNMSKVFFEQLEIPNPEEYLDVGSASHAQQTANIMSRFEPVLQKHRPDWVSVVGDVNSTVACALVCAKLGVPIAHVEAGLRSRDRTMPEEINRILTDQMSDLLLIHSAEGGDNLRNEGIDPEKIHFVGNVMIDTLVTMLPQARSLSTVRDLGLRPREYLLVTLHRPYNVDHGERLKEILLALVKVSESYPIVFPVHPRTRQKFEQANVPLDSPNLKLLEPLGYLDFLALMDAAGVVLTDSGGLQEETAYLGVPCLTARPNTERPVTIECGTNQLVESRFDALVDAIHSRWDEPRDGFRKPELWDGRAADRIVDLLLTPR